MAIIAGLGTGWPWAALIPGLIGFYGWYALRTFFQEWPEPTPQP
jgi:hypothetical protein